MPTYDFICNHCQNHFSLLLSIKDRDEGKGRCPHCDSSHITQRFTSFLFKKVSGQGGSCSGNSCKSCTGC